ncbi:MAG: dual specificity protein phosphatase family protein [bacterium]|nr:dual specificity protein phosphatase family protein [bacterium]
MQNIIWSRNKTSKIVIPILLLTTVITLACSPVRPRPDNWAQPVSLAGVPNLFQVSENLYRSAQPDTLGMNNLKQLGIKTVVNLRSFHSDQDELGNTGLVREHIYMKAWHPEKEDVVRFLKIMADSARAPVLVHCQHGSDRTGTMCAIYRVAVQGWSKEEAIREMTQGGFGFHKMFSNLPKWIKALDIEQVRKEAGITFIPPPAAPKTNPPRQK